MAGCDITDFFELADQLPEVTRDNRGRYWRVAVSDHTFGYLWEPTCTVGLKQTISEQLALVAEAWRLTAPTALTEARGDRLPR